MNIRIHPKQERLARHLPLKSIPNKNACPIMNTTRNLFLALFALSCTPAAGTQTQDMTAAERQTAAGQEEHQATEHQAQHDPNATKTDNVCAVGKGRVCWTVTQNPTNTHVASAEEHHRLAAQHRAASLALQSAETQACSGLDGADRDTSPFVRRGDIRSVAPLKEERMIGKNKEMRDAGATVVFQAVPGLTAEWLQRIMDCHLARNGAVGHDMPEMPYCPLVPKGAQAKVRSVGDGFAVDVRADDEVTAKEILRRAQLITASH